MISTQGVMADDTDGVLTDSSLQQRCSLVVSHLKLAHPH